MADETFEAIAGKLQSELIDIIKYNKQVNDYELIVYKYVFITELKIPLMDEFDVEITEDSFMIHVIPDGLQLSLLTKLDEAFDRFTVSFMPNEYNLLKLKFKLSD